MNNDSVDVKIAKNTTKIGALEDDVSKLQEKWDSMQKLVIGSLVSTVFTLIGIVVVLLKMK